MTDPADRFWSAERTLQRLGYTYTGRAKWKPPIGPTPNFGRLDEKNTELAEGLSLRVQLARMLTDERAENARLTAALAETIDYIRRRHNYGPQRREEIRLDLLMRFGKGETTTQESPP